MKAGLDREQQFFDRGLFEDRNEIHAAQPRNYCQSFRLRGGRPALAFLRAGLSVAVDRDDEDVAEIRRSLKISQMADVENVEAPVRQNEPRTGLAQVGNRCSESFTLQD